jgi:hypothetical protein
MSSKRERDGLKVERGEKKGKISPMSLRQGRYATASGSNVWSETVLLKRTSSRMLRRNQSQMKSKLGQPQVPPPIVDARDREKE